MLKFQEIRGSSKTASNCDSNYLTHLRFLNSDEKTGQKIGRPVLSTHALGQVHDIIKLTSPIRQGISEKVVALSALGKSQRWIASELKVSKSWVQWTLERNEKELGKESKGTFLPIKSAFRCRIGRPPFGFDFLEGRLLENPRELHTVQKIIALWNSGHSFRATAKELNRLKLKTRKGTNWDHSVVSDIILRAQGSDSPYARFSKDLRPTKTKRGPKTHRANDLNVEEPKPKTQYDIRRELHE